MLSHVFIGITDFDRAMVFYQPIMAALNLQTKFCDSTKPWAGWMSKDAPRPLFVIGTPFDEHPATPGNGQMIALLAPNREIVSRCHALALANGGSCEGPPGLVRITTPTTTAPTCAIPTATSSASVATSRVEINDQPRIADNKKPAEAGFLLKTCD